MGLKNYMRHSKAARKSRRWLAVRLEAKRRDGWRCRKCGSVGRLEVDHIKPVRDAPELAFELSNLQTLCVGCHSKKTRIEIGLGREDPAREAWKTLLSETRKENVEVS